MTTPPTTLQDTLRAELDRRLAVARAATPAWANVGTVVEAGPDGVPFVGNDYVVEHIALHDPSAALAALAGAVVHVLAAQVHATLAVADALRTDPHLYRMRRR